MWSGKTEYNKRPLGERFFSKVNKCGPKIIETRCWEWIARSNARGYGKLNIDGKHFRANRISLFIATGRMPKECVLHRCDNPKCVNPEHIYEGNRKQNANDCISRGRHINSNKTHCSRGHEYSNSNTRIYKGKRFCRACARIYKSREYVEEKAGIKIWE